MNAWINSPMGQRLCRLFGAQLKTDYRLSLSLYPDKESETPTCTHDCTGSSQHPLATLLAWGALIVLACTIVHGICGLLSKLLPSK